MDQAGNGFAVVEIAWGEAEGEELAAIIDHQMELEPVESLDRGFPVAGVHLEDTAVGSTRASSCIGPADRILASQVVLKDHMLLAPAYRFHILDEIGHPRSYATTARFAKRNHGSIHAESRRLIRAAQGIHRASPSG
jgi:hypothetical protein